MTKDQFYQYQEVGMGEIYGVKDKNYFIINNKYVLGGDAAYALNNPELIALNDNMEVDSPTFDNLEELYAYLDKQEN